MRMLKFRSKPLFLVLYVKKYKIMSRVNPYFSTKFYLFLLAYMTSRLFMKQLGSHIGYEDVHATFFLIIQNIFKLHLK
jgi:hypothetical protein